MRGDIFEAFNKKPVEMPIIAVTGGKGGTGKTTVAVNLTVALKNKGQRIMLVDTDVDSPTTAIILGVEYVLKHVVHMRFFKLQKNFLCSLSNYAQDVRHASWLVLTKQ
jgi:MinD superfamily P-loop ATPase